MGTEKWPARSAQAYGAYGKLKLTITKYFRSLIIMKSSANPFRLTNGCINGSALAFMMLVGCTTTQEIKRPNGAVEYVIACGAGSGWNVCYHKANEICPTGYTTVSEDAGFNRKELHIACPKPLSPN